MADRAALILRDWTPEAVEAFEPVAAVEPYSGGLASLSSILQGAYLVEAEGRGLLAMRPHHHPGGALEVCIAGAVSTDGGRPQSFWAFNAAERFAAMQGADVLSFGTPHGALARAGQRHGWALAGYILRKSIKVQ